VKIIRKITTRAAVLAGTGIIAAAGLGGTGYALAASHSPASAWVCVSTTDPGVYYTESPGGATHEPVPHACARGFTLVGVGDPGATGAAGKQGPAGATGAAGAVGPAGAAGAPGPIGEPGPTGPAGPAGPVGSTGPPGPAGAAGTTGATGATGAAGAAGADPSSVQLTGTIGTKTYVVTCSAAMVQLEGDAEQLQLSDCTDTVSG
jgi:hypothetical protein